jgi:hypothetical protein
MKPFNVPRSSRSTDALTTMANVEKAAFAAPL